LTFGLGYVGEDDDDDDDVGIDPGGVFCKFCEF
jgi:hypothetical protein